MTSLKGSHDSAFFMTKRLAQNRDYTEGQLVSVPFEVHGHGNFLTCALNSFSCRDYRSNGDENKTGPNDTGLQ